MQQYKFRGKRKSDGEWVYGYLIGTNWIVGEVVDSSEEYIAPEFWWRVIPETVGMYIGKEDEAGKEIYEHDIVRLGTMGSTFIIKFEDLRFYGANNEGYRFIPQQLDLRTTTGFVIGNVFDNPEMIYKPE